MGTRAGFTLVEILISLAILSALLGLGLYASVDSYRGYRARSGENTLVNLLEKARSHAMTNVDEAPWGVCFETGAYVLFPGARYDGSDARDESLDAGGASVSGIDCAVSGVVFSQLAGTTTPTTVDVTGSGKTKAITINYAGRIQ